MLFGLCVNMTPEVSRLAGAHYAEKLKSYGYDYIEMPINIFNMLPEEEFREAKKMIRDSSLPCRTCNDFMPTDFLIAGENLTPEHTLSEYLKRAFFRIGAEGLGARYVVFGSPWSRSCPEGFPFDTAWKQVADFLHMAGEIAATQGLTIAVENNNHTETNMMNHLVKTSEMVDEIGLDSVRMHCDYYHLRFEGEDMHAPELYAGKIVHTHIAKLKDRAYFTDTEDESQYLAEYAKALHAISYNGGMSLEAKPDPEKDWDEQAKATIRTLRSVFQ